MILPPGLSKPQMYGAKQSSTLLLGTEVKGHPKPIAAWPDLCHRSSCPLVPGQLCFSTSHFQTSCPRSHRSLCLCAFYLEPLFLCFETQLQCHLLGKPHFPKLLETTLSSGLPQQFVRLQTWPPHSLNDLFTHLSSTQGSELRWEPPRAGACFTHPCCVAGRNLTVPS